MNSTYYIVMDYIDGETLYSLNETAKLDFSAKIEIILSLCDILDYLHNNENNIFFVDLKPENILVDKKNIPYLIDFGISGHNEEREFVSLTLGYTAPEVYHGEIDEKSDIYSLGCVLNYLLQNENVSSKLEDVILKCKEEKSKDRYENIANVKEAIENALAQTEGFEPTIILEKKKDNISKKAIVLIMISLLLVGSIIVYIVQSFNDVSDFGGTEPPGNLEENVEGTVYISDMEWGSDEGEFWCLATVYNYSMNSVPYKKLILSLKLELSDGTEKKVDLVFALPKIGADKRSTKLTTKTSFEKLKIGSEISIINASYTEYRFE